MLTTEEIKRVKKIQNSQYSLGWGSSALSDTETLFVVGHSYYKRVIKYFIITDDYSLFVLNEDNSRTDMGQYKGISDCIKLCIIPLLKEWFPPSPLKEAADCAHKEVFQSAT